MQKIVIHVLNLNVFCHFLLTLDAGSEEDRSGRKVSIDSFR